MAVSSFNKTGEDYSSISAWEGATDNDLVTAAEGEILEIYSDDGDIAESSLIYGATTNATYYREIRAVAADRHVGVWDATKVVIDNSTSGTHTIRIVENYARTEGLQFYGPNSTNHYAISVEYDYIHVHKCIIDAHNAGRAGMLVAGDSCEIYRNIIYDNKFYGAVRDTAATATKYYNNTIYDTADGILDNGANPICINNIVMDAASNDFEGSFDASSDYNISSDTTAPGTNSLASRTATASTTPGAGDWVIFENISTGSEDLRLVDNSTDNDAIDAGTNLGSPYDVDIAGNTVTGTWDIGAFEVQGGAAATSLLPLRRINLGALLQM